MKSKVVAIALATLLSFVTVGLFVWGLTIIIWKVRCKREENRKKKAFYSLTQAITRTEHQKLTETEHKKLVVKTSCENCGRQYLSSLENIYTRCVECGNALHYKVPYTRVEIELEEGEVIEAKNVIHNDDGWVCEMINIILKELYRDDIEKVNVVIKRKKRDDRGESS